MIYWLRKYFTDPRAHWAAAYEVILTAAFSLMPFLITYFVESAKRQDGTFFQMDNLVGRGQLFLLSYGIFGTVFWLAFMKDERPRHGARAFLGAVATLSVVPMIGYLGVDPTFSTVMNRTIIIYSYWIYGMLILINYLLLFYINVTPPQTGDILDRETNDMRARYEEMNRG